MVPRPVPLILKPTPLHRLNLVSEELGLDLWIKRDDLTGFALGGNKGRKLEYLMAEALEARAQVVVTCGSLHSNFVRQLGAACARFGMGCVAVVMNMPYDAPAGKPEGGLAGGGGNALCDAWLGVRLKPIDDGDWEHLYDEAEIEAKRLESEGLRVYRIPVGGSSPLGAYAFYEAAAETKRQAPESFDTILFASSSGSTQVGLSQGFLGCSTRVLGISCDPEPEIAGDFERLSADLAKLTGAPPTPACDFNLDFEFVGDGYGVPSAAGDAAIAFLARREGVFLDPIYTGKAFAALLELAKRGELCGRTLFWHTGGVPNLFAHVPPRAC